MKKRVIFQPQTMVISWDFTTQLDFNKKNIGVSWDFNQWFTQLLKSHIEFHGDFIGIFQLQQTMVIYGTQPGKLQQLCFIFVTNVSVIRKNPIPFNTVCIIFLNVCINPSYSWFFVWSSILYILYNTETQRAYAAMLRGLGREEGACHQLTGQHGKTEEPERIRQHITSLSHRS